MSVDIPDETIEDLIRREQVLPQFGSPNDHGGHRNMDWIRSALLTLLKAERARILEGSG